MLVDICLCCSGSIVWLEKSHECAGGCGKSIPCYTQISKCHLCQSFDVNNDASKRAFPMLRGDTSAVDTRTAFDLEFVRGARLPCKKTLPLAMLLILCA